MCQPRLPDTRRTEHREESAASFRRHLFKRGAQSSQLLPASDQRGIQTTWESRSALDHLQQPESPHRIGLSFEHERLHRFDLDRTTREVVGRLADQNFVGLRGLLETRSDIDGVTCCEALFGTRDDLPTVDPSAQLQHHAKIPFKLLESQGINEARRSEAARTARRASSSCIVGTPKTAITASPMNFSTVPP